ncbi:PQQ-binding-like beta-propeller repeat protein [Halosolutus gelatinilyticus]|uniref:outer membrane protein assembly factor BamB family protein n=1 Tax=Halosolutus gelatinilyticus TaxID=2931975 RepID=UPI001FF182B8|nr:PQQ-binding-like beta-propeller repeat protein [Halosolutus gelatinilyticus]
MTDWNQFKGDRANAGVRRDLDGPRRVEERWRVDLSGPIRSSPALDRDTVYVGTSVGNLFALDRETGHRRWVFETFAAIDAAPAVTDDSVYTGTADGTIRALDPSTGELRWETELPGDLTTSLSLADAGLDDERLFVGHANGTSGTGLSAIDADTGEILWCHETDGEIAGCPAIDDERVYVGTDAETVLAVAIDTGDLEWEVPADGSITDGPTLADGLAYAGDDAGTLLALDAETGQTWFTYGIDDVFTSSATVLPEEETTFVGAADGYLHVTDTTFGRRKVRGWLFSKNGIALDGSVRSSPVVAGDICIAGDETGSLFGIDAAEFDLLWHFAVEGAVRSTPAIAEERLYVGSDDERLYCLEWGPDEPIP